MRNERNDGLPPIVYAQITPIRVGAASVFDTDGPMAPDEIAAYESDEATVNAAVALLEAAGFRVLQRTATSLTIAAPPEVYEAAFDTRLVARELPVTKPGPATGTATFIDTADNDRPGHLDPGGTPLANVIEGGAIEAPRYPLAGPPASPAGRHRLPGPDHMFLVPGTRYVAATRVAGRPAPAGPGVEAARRALLVRTHPDATRDRARPGPADGPGRAVLEALRRRRLQVCVLDDTGRLAHTCRWRDGSWPAFPGDVEAANTELGGIRAVAAALDEDRLHLVAIDGDGRLWHTGRAGDGRWQGAFRPVGPVAGGGPVPATEVAAAVVQGRLHVLAVVTGGGLVHLHCGPGGTWRPGAGAELPPDRGGITQVAAAASAGRLHVVVLDGAGGPRHAVLGDDGASPTVGTAAVPGGGLGPGSRIAAAADAAGLHLLGIDAGGRVRHAVRRPDGSWGPGLDEVTATRPGSARAVDVAARALADGLHLVTTTADGRLHHALHRAGGWRTAIGRGDVTGRDSGRAVRCAV